MWLIKEAIGQERGKQVETENKKVEKTTCNPKPFMR
jgi:hypothetical protein